MGEVWVAAVGTAVAIGGTAYSIYSSQSAINAANSVHPPKFVPIDTQKVAADAKAADEASYAASDADWKARFPELYKGRDYAIKDSVSALKGDDSKKINSGLSTSGLSANIGEGPFGKAISLGAPVLSQEQRDRTYFQTLLSANPRRQFGLSGADVAHIAIANTNSQNNFNQGLFGSRINQYNSAIQQTGQNIGAAVAGVNGAINIFGSIAQNNQLSQYLNSHFYDSGTGPSTGT